MSHICWIIIEMLILWIIVVNNFCQCHIFYHLLWFLFCELGIICWIIFVCVNVWMFSHIFENLIPSNTYSFSFILVNHFSESFLMVSFLESSNYFYELLYVSFVWVIFESYFCESIIFVSDFCESFLSIIFVNHFCELLLLFTFVTFMFCIILWMSVFE